MSITKLQKCFPAMDKDFFAILGYYIRKSKISNNRLIYSTDFVVMNNKYRTFSVSDLLSIDARVHVIDYDEACNLGTNNPKICWVVINNEKKRVYLSDAKKFNLNIIKTYKYGNI